VLGFKITLWGGFKNRQVWKLGLDELGNRESSQVSEQSHFPSNYLSFAYAMLPL
jgi:hypothetical protein